MYKRLFSAALAAGIGLAAIAGSPASAENPNRTEAHDWIGLFADTENGLSVWVNITARDFCDWLSGPPTGPPPAIDPVVIQSRETGQGAVVGRFNTEAHIEIWEFDEDPSPLLGPCEDIAEQLADPEAEPFATGTTTWTGRTNDAFETGTRGNSFGESGRAMVTDGDGTDYRYSWMFHLNDQCHTPEFGPPRCLGVTNTLTPI